jgi:hypothetical protein
MAHCNPNQKFNTEHELPTKPFRLLHLPPEIWLQICHHAVVQTNPIVITASPTSSGQELIVQQPALTRTCRLLRSELLPFFYHHNNFEAYHLDGVTCPRKWFAALGRANLLAMGSFTFHAQFSPKFWTNSFASLGIDVEIETVQCEGGEKDRGPVHGLQMLWIRFV